MKAPGLNGAPVTDDTTGNQSGGRRHRGASVKTLKKILKKNGLKTTGKKATLTRRAKKAHLKMRGGEEADCGEGMVKNEKGECVASGVPGGKRRKSRSRGLLGKLF
jgi:hypothetical protein